MRRLILILLIATALSGCRESTQNAPAGDAITIEMEAAAQTTGASELTVTLTDAQGAPVEAQKVEARGDMTHAGMAPVLAETAEGKNGMYVIPFEWTMSGDWIVTVTVTLADGTTAEKRFNLSIRD